MEVAQKKPFSWSEWVGFSNWSEFWGNVFSKTSQDDLFTLSAAVSFYLALSLSPFLLLLLAALALLNPGLQDELVVQVAVLVGSNASQAIGAIIENMRGAEQGTVSVVSVISLITLLISASAVFGQLKSSLDLIIRTPKKPEPPPHDESYKSMILGFLKQKLLTVGMVLTFILIAIVSMVASSLIGFFIARFNSWDAKIASLANIIISLVVFTGFLTAVFHWVPVRIVEWKSAFRAGFLTAVLFMIGKSLIGLYLASGAISSSYGAAGSFLALLVWMYYSSMIIFFCAEVANELQNWKDKH